MPKRVFVTVGTTQFPKLIETVSSKEVQNTLKEKGYSFIQVQCGKGWKVAKEDPPSQSETSPKIQINFESYFENFHDQILHSDLVISHAGAGSCLDVLRLKKPLIVVVNEDLMDNHQRELGEQLHNDGYVYCCTCDELNETLKLDIQKLKTFPQPDNELFAHYLDNCMGFVK